MAEEQENNEQADALDPNEGAGRRAFIKKLAYIAPILETYLLVEEAEAQNRGNTRVVRGNRGKRNVSPVPGRDERDDDKDDDKND